MNVAVVRWMTRSVFRGWLPDRFEHTPLEHCFVAPHLMNRFRLRTVAVIVLVLLGAPVALHVVMHDLHHGHHDDLAIAFERQTGHGDHEHPVVSSPAPPAPSLVRVALPLEVPRTVTATTWIRIATADRNVRSFGALRMDDDIGLHSLHATFLI